MSQAALDYVQESPEVKALPAAEKLVLRQIAMLHKLEVNCAFVPIPMLTTLSLIGGKDPERQCRRILERLEKKGFLRRHAARGSNGRQVSNEYELPGMRLSTAVTEQMRQQVFTTPRTRVAAQQSLFFADGGFDVTTANGSEGLAVADTNRSNGLAVADSAVGSMGLAVESDEAANAAKNAGRAPSTLAVEDVAECPPPPGHLSVLLPPDTLVSSLDVVFDVVLEVSPPPTPAPALEVCKSASQEQEQRTTARATATATTPVMRPAVVSMERGGEAGMSSGARVIPFGRRARLIPFGRRVRRDAGAERERLDGFEAALFDETMRVLGECGVGPKSMTRRQRNAVQDALLAALACESATWWSIAEAGAHLVRQWEEYLGCQAFLTCVLGVQRFFGSGMWRDQRLWNWNMAARERQRDRRDASVGMA